MSFQIRDKKKIQVFRKCVQLLTAHAEEFHIHFTKTHIRLFNTFSDETTYMIDLSASWFSKFVAPECILQQELEELQIKMHRDVFLQSFNIIEDTELEFLVNFETVDVGFLKVIKTRDLYIVEANVPFEIERDITCNENYEFPDNKLLIHSEAKQFKNLRGVFKTKAKTEILHLVCSPETLTFHGEFNNKFGYDIKTQNLKNYGVYLHEGFEEHENFQISIGLKHILGLLKICELADGYFMTAMEQIEIDSCICFLFSNSFQKDFKFCIGIGGVKFTPLNQDTVDQIKKVPQIIKRENQNQIIQQQQLRREEDGAPVNIGNLNIKCEDNGPVGLESNTFNINQHHGAEEESELLTAVTKPKPRQRLTKKVVNDEENADFNMNLKQEGDQRQETEDEGAHEEDEAHNVKVENYDNVKAKNQKKKKQESDSSNEDEDNEDEETLAAKKRDFYRDVDKEEFF